ILKGNWVLAGAQQSLRILLLLLLDSKCLWFGCRDLSKRFFVCLFRVANDALRHFTILLGLMSKGACYESTADLETSGCGTSVLRLGEGRNLHYVRYPGRRMWHHSGGH